MFVNQKSYIDFKAICVKENIEFRPYTISSEKTMSIVLKGLIHIPVARINKNLKSQELSLTHWAEMPTHTKYAICRNQIRAGYNISTSQPKNFILDS